MKQGFKNTAIVFACFCLVAASSARSLMADDTDGYTAVTGPCHQTFPKDHGPHPGFRTEWWYYTGNLVSKSGHRYGFQLTFFRSQISPGDAAQNWPRPSSAWRTQQIYAGHAAVSDLDGNRHQHAELLGREALGIAGITHDASQTKVFIKNWSATINADRHSLIASTPDFSIDLRLTSAKPPVLHGQAGYSRKGSTADRASCYYSLTRLISNGELKIGGRTVEVEGLSWMDHEYSTASLETGIVGWDWFSLQLSDQTELMLYLLREESGKIHAASSGTYVHSTGQALHLTRTDFKVTALEQWKSPRSEAVYPVAWRIKVQPLAMDMTIAANLADQEMVTSASTGVTYWEGSVSASGSVANQPVKASGYVELTGYAAALRAPL
ncbi:MAG: lipocalin-like domain-containing protein [Desulfobacterales bacterium]|nr:lipocalin-like domain-containing protein [Desulfobacterales bacterium]